MNNPITDSAVTVDKIAISTITTRKIAGPAITTDRAPHLVVAGDITGDNIVVSSITADAAMPGVLTMLKGMLDDGTIDRFHYGVEARLDAQSRNAGEMVLTVYSDGTYVVQGKHDAAYDAASVSDHVVSIPLVELSAAIRGALN